MAMQILSSEKNGISGMFRAAITKLSRPALWKRRRELRVCETLSLGNRNFLAVVGYQEQRFLIAGTANSIALLADLTIETHLDSERAEAEEDLPAA